MTLKRLFKSSTSLTLSLSLALTSMAGMGPAYSVRVEAQESDYSVGFKLAEELTQLLDRAAYPDIPRRGKTGVPTSAELAGVLARTLSLKQSLQNGYLNRVLEPLSIDAEEQLQQTARIVKDMDKYFEVVSRLEGLKIVLGLQVEPETWESLYNLKFPLKDLSQVHFLEAISAFAQNAVLLPVEGYDKEELQKLIAQGSFFVTHIEALNGAWQLTFRLNPSFAQRSEQLSFLTRPSLRSGLQYAGHFAMHRLYDSLVLTRSLRGQSPTSLPAPPAAAQARYLSLKVARFQAVRDYQTALDQEVKPQVYKALLDAAETSGVRALTNEFYANVGKLTGQELGSFTDKELAMMQKGELIALSRALSALLNLSDINDWEGLPRHLLREGERLALRHIFLASEVTRLSLSTENLAALEDLIDQAADTFATNVLAKAKLDFKALSAQSFQSMMSKKRSEFQKNLEAASVLLRDFKKQPLRIDYIYGAQAPYIQDLQPSESTRKLAEQLSQVPEYNLAYLNYKAALASILSEFQLNGGAVPALDIDSLSKQRSRLKWNPAALKGKVPDKYLSAVTPKSGWFSGLIGKPVSPRDKDLSDLLEIGRLLKFNVFEKLERKDATVENMKLDDTLLGPVLGSEHKAYLEEMKKDLLNNSPLLGGIVGKQGTAPRHQGNMLWQALADDQLAATSKYDLVEKQLAYVEKQIHVTEREVADQLAKIDAIEGENVSGLSHDMLVVSTRAYQISKSLEPFASFESFYSKMRQSLLEPGFWRSEWQDFSTWANNSATYVILIMVAQLIGSRVGPVGKAADPIASLLTPFCGPNFRCLGPVFMGLIGIGLSDQLYRGFYSEAKNLDSLRKYFETGSGAPGVALYTDVKQQTDVMMQPRYEAMITVVMVAAIMGGFAVGRKLLNRFSGPGTSAVEILKKDMQTLGLPQTSSLSREALQASVRDSLKRARQTSDPVARAQLEAYISQVYARMESTLHKEALSWNAFEQRYSQTLRRVGLSKASWTDAQELTRALNQVEAAYKNGQLLRSDYQEQMAALMNVYQRLAPVWQQIEKEPLLAAYYTRSWQLASGSSDISLTANIASYNLRVTRPFLKAMDEFYGAGTSSSRMDTIIENIAQELKSAPQLRAKRIEQLKRYLEEGARK
ncbi:MAG: hypothetical protein KF799_15005 [Bdellovibrionales bacterium]|nr:hypothetical protein [Bdellovibrionales bacterium]